MRTHTIAAVAVVWTVLASPLAAQKGGTQPSAAPAGGARAAAGDENAGTFSDGQLTIVLRRSGSGTPGRRPLAVRLTAAAVPSRGTLTVPSVRR